MIIKGKAHKFGNDVNTDDIIAAKYLVTTNAPELGKHCMEHLRPEFAKNVQKGDIIVAGKYFGCGSSREHAPLAILGCGVSAVIAKNFASIFYRNSINIGLPILECECADEIDEQDALEIDLSSGVIKNITKNKTYRVQPFPAFLQNIIKSGGLIAYVSKKQE